MRFDLRLIAVAIFAWPFSIASADERAAADYNARLGGVSFLVMENGRTTFENYPNGGAPERAWELASGTKSFSGVLAAVAVKDGLLRLDERASDTLAEWRADGLKKDVTLRQILTLTSGLKPARVGKPPSYADAVNFPMLAEPGATFEYGPLNFQIFGEILRRKLQSFEGGRFKTPLDYLQARIFDPLGMRPAQWNRDADGQPNLPSGADFTAREWAQFGEFVRLGGRHEGRLLVDEQALAENFVGSDVNAGYGLTWWLNATPKDETLARSRTMREASDLFTHPRRHELPEDLFMAAGAGGQRLYVIPSRGLVVVRQYPKLFELGKRSRSRQFSDVELLLALLE